MWNKKFLGYLAVVLFWALAFTMPITAQAQKKNPDKIRIIQADSINAVKSKYGGDPMAKGKVILQHKGTKMYCDSVLLRQGSKFMKAWGKVKFINDTIRLESDSMQYSGASGVATAMGRVRMKDRRQTITAEKIVYNRKNQIATAVGNVKLDSRDGETVLTDKLVYNRAKQTASYNSGGTVLLKDGSVRSQKVWSLVGSQKRYIFTENVIIDQPDFKVFTDKADIRDAEGLIIITGKDSRIVDKKDRNNYIITSNAHFRKNKKDVDLYSPSVIYNDGKELWGNRMYFNDETGYGWAKGNVLLDDPTEGRYVRGEYGEVFREMDSAYVTGQAFAVKAFKEDSLYLHADTIMAVRRNKNKSMLKGFFNTRFYKGEMSGKADSLNFNETDGILRLFRDPIIWSKDQQITGDTIYVYNNTQTEKTDSILVFRNAFAISKADSLTTTDYNQVKGRRMLGIFKDNDLDWVEVKGNAQSLSFMDEEKDGQKSRIGINRSDCGIIEAEITKRQVDILSCRIKANSKLYPESMLPDKARYLKDFAWRGDEQLLKWYQIFYEPKSKPYLPPPAPKPGFDKFMNTDSAKEKEIDKPAIDDTPPGLEDALEANEGIE